MKWLLLLGLYLSCHCWLSCLNRLYFYLLNCSDLLRYLCLILVLCKCELIYFLLLSSLCWLILLFRFYLCLLIWLFLYNFNLFIYIIFRYLIWDFIFLNLICFLLFQFCLFFNGNWFMIVKLLDLFFICCFSFKFICFICFDFDLNFWVLLQLGNKAFIWIYFCTLVFYLIQCFWDTHAFLFDKITGD